ncbi:MAG: putative sulfate exporter family transporter [Nevskia sp.]|nr:putative sulfate exporter family transporter [Nevskia sp.]
MSELQSGSASGAAVPAWKGLFAKEDWWAIWIGVGLVLVAVALFACGSSIKWLAVSPQKWSHLPEAFAQYGQHAGQYFALFVLWAVLFGLGALGLGIKLTEFLPSFAFVFVVSVILYFIGQWDQASKYSLEPPLVGLGLGLLISNTIALPKWLQAGFRVEFYIKTGIVLLGAGLPFTLIIWAGPVAIAQAAIVSLVTFGVIYFVATKLGLDRRLAAVLGTGGAVCGVSGAIAVAGAVGAKKEHAPIAISLVVFWAIVMIFLLPIVSRALQLPTGVAGAWIGTSEFADAAGFAAAQTYGGYAGNVPGISGNADAAVNAFTLMKVIGRDIWIGIWALVLSIIATTRWDNTGIQNKAGAGETWRRFPKFVIGFLIASAIITVISRGYSYADYRKSLTPALIAPIQALRVWAFTFTFFSIGLTTRIRDFAGVGPRPFYAFTAGVIVNVVLGYVLSTQVFGSFWSSFGQ